MESIGQLLKAKISKKLLKILRTNQRLSVIWNSIFDR